ncbi:hypothetical protein GCM10017687_01950 [Streptomyces echinatus]|uniref:hypothetical protein n=1 Tax=Streptomyces echinatus TaxID=67293 RepID=UPI0031EB1C56
MADDFGMSRSYAALSISVFVIGAAAPVVLWGVAADRYGRRGPLLASLAPVRAHQRGDRTDPVPRGAAGAAGAAGPSGAGGAAIIARILVRDRWSGDELAKRLSVLSIAFITAMAAASSSVV